MGGKAAMETRLQDFVKSKTAESVYLDLSSPSIIVVKRRGKQGSILLGTFWMNVLQHPNNYPVQRYPYKKLYDKNGHYKVMLRVDDVSITVYMTTGTLTIQGSFVLDWFLKRFSKVMDAYDMPHLEPQPVSDGYLEHEKKWTELMKKDAEEKEKMLQKQRDLEEKTLTLDDMPPLEIAYVKEETNLTREEAPEEKKSAEKGETTVEDLTDDLELLSLDLWTGDVLNRQLTQLGTPIIKDGPNYIYKLWKSLLSHWLSNPDSHVYLATPFLDTDRMIDICDLVLKNFTTANIEAFFVRIKCNYTEKISDVKRNAQNHFPGKMQPVIEYKVYNSIVYPLSTFHAKFIGCTDGKGGAEVMVTSANFTADHFKHHNTESVAYHTMSEADFIHRFIKPLTNSRQT
ncbi:uncharacterized protein LOC134235860 [Saccostrea cucullata]|uniref:uncharacterized protein LOC134235860 n=1 Tax=Saccostrea cuccullata TaxID=36930 RepID=UPI002ED2A04B